MYVPLKIVSEYTLLSSTIRIDDLILFLKNNNINFLNQGLKHNITK